MWKRPGLHRQQPRRRQPPSAAAAAPTAAAPTPLPPQAKVGGGAEKKYDQALPNHTAALGLVTQHLSEAYSGVG